MPIPQRDGLVPPLNEEPTVWTVGSIDLPADPAWLATFRGVLRVIIERENWDEVNEDEVVADLDKILLVADAIYFSIAYGGGSMSCEDIADCIDTDAGVLTAILSQLVANGFTQNNPTSAPSAPYLTPAQTAENLLPASYSCSDAQIMATAKALTVAFDRAVTDILEEIELLTDPAELLAILGDNVEFVSYLTSFGEVATWVQDTFASIYNASYDAIVEQNIACLIYCAAIVDCEITHDMLIDVMIDGMGAITPPADPNDIQALFAWIVGIDTSVGEAVVCAFFWFVLQTMKFAASLLPEGFVVIADLKRIIQSSMGQTDTSYVDCDDCPPDETADTYWMLYKDFRLGLGDWVINQGIATANGIETLTYGGQARAGVQINNLGNEFQVQAAGVRSQRRGSIGNGTNDFARYFAYPNINLGGTPVQPLSLSSITCNTNDCDAQNVLVAPTSACESLYIQIGIDGAHVYPTNFGRIVEAVLYGLCNGTAKPPNSVYVASIPSAGSLFPS